MSEAYIIRNCAPTLAGLKTGNMFTCPYENEAELLDTLRNLNRRLRSKGLRLVPLRISQQRALLYLFRPKKLSQDLAHSSAEEILRCCGYCTGSCEKCVRQLTKKLRQQEDFPHEIGLFLGYPPEDVRGFMENRDCGCKCTGCWKVYGDEAAAKKKFSQYKKCSKIYWDLWRSGKSLEKLTVAR